MMFGSDRSSMFINPPQISKCCPYDRYLTVTNFCESILQIIIENALEVIDNMGTIIYDDYSGKCMRQMGQFGNIWPTCGNLTMRSGLNSLIKEMELWNTLPLLKDWMFYPTFIGLQRILDSEVYTYEALWSVPTPAYPEPEVTVSVFFYISANSKYPPHYPIDIQYKFEGHQFFHKLNTIFRPKWIYDILDMKTMISQSFDF